MNLQKRISAPPALSSKKRAAASVSAICPEQPSQHAPSTARYLLPEEPDYGCVDWFMYPDVDRNLGAGDIAGHSH